MAKPRGTPAWEVPRAWPSTPSLRAVHGTSLANVYAVGDRGAILHSTDRGATWTRLESRSDLFFSGVWVGDQSMFATANVLADDDPSCAMILRFEAGTMRSAHQFDDVQLATIWGTDTAIFAGGSQGVKVEDGVQSVGIVVRSLDGGATWTGKSLGTGPVVAIGGTGSTLHALTRDGWLATSTDRGTTFTFARLPEDTYEALDVTPGRLLAASSHRDLVRSTDGGATWATVRPHADGHVWSAGDLVLAFHNGSLDRSHDGGTTWTTHSTREIVDAVWGTGDGLVAVGQNGLVLTSRDGAVWERRDRGVVGALSDVWGAGERDVYVVGSDGGRGGVIARTTDGGASFSFARGGWPALTGVWSDTSGLVVVVGHDGTILRSTDRGAAWSPVDSGTSRHLAAVAACEPRALYAVGEGGTILHSRDRGASWQPIVGGAIGRLTDVACVGGVIYAAGPIDVLRLDAGRAIRFGAPPTADQREREWSKPRARVLGWTGDVCWISHDRLRCSKDGSTWRKVHDGPIYAGWAVGETLWLAGWSGAVITLDRAGRAREQWTGVDGSFPAIWGSAHGALWAVAQGTLVHHPASRTSAVTPAR